MFELVPDLMPETFVIQDRKWRDGKEPSDENRPDLPWFVKEADRNWGTSVHVVAKAEQCMEPVCARTQGWAVRTRSGRRLRQMLSKLGVCPNWVGFG